MSSGVINKRGYRLNVGIVLANQHGRLLLARRMDHADAWQFPQGGMLPDETPREAMYRELTEELGLMPDEVECIAQTKNWLRYRLPKHFRRYNERPLCVGQKQKWFLLRLLADEDQIQLNSSEKPEFDRWQWVDYWYPLTCVIEFKYGVYRNVLQEFAGLV